MSTLMIDDHNAVLAWIDSSKDSSGKDVTAVFVNYFNSATGWSTPEELAKYTYTSENPVSTKHVHIAHNDVGAISIAWDESTWTSAGYDHKVWVSDKQ